MAMSKRITALRGDVDLGVCDCLKVSAPAQLPEIFMGTFHSLE